VSRNFKDWADKISDAFWAYRIDFKTALGMSHFRVVFGKPCHIPILYCLPVEPGHWAMWAMKTLNLDLEVVAVKRKLQLSELDKIRIEEYENSRKHKERI